MTDESSDLKAKADKILREVFKHEKYRTNLQEKAITSVLKGRDEYQLVTLLSEIGDNAKSPKIYARYHKIIICIICVH